MRAVGGREREGKTGERGGGRVIERDMRLNIGKTVVVDIDGGSGELDPPKLTNKNQPVKVFQANESCRHLSFGATPNGDMTVTKQRVLTKTEEVLGILTHHSLEAKIPKEL